MIIEPRAGRLIARICDTLERTVLATMTPSHPQRQLKAGLWALRDLASRIDRQGDAVRADIEEMQAFFARYAGALGDVGDVGGAEEAAMDARAPIDGGDGTDGRDAGVSDADRHVRLQARLADAEARLHANDAPGGVRDDETDRQPAGTPTAPDIDRALRALYLRMLARELGAAPARDDDAG